jgi:hypothetical protein
MQWMRLWISLWGKLRPMTARRDDALASMRFSVKIFLKTERYDENLW